VVSSLRGRWKPNGFPELSNDWYKCHDIERRFTRFSMRSVEAAASRWLLRRNGTVSGYPAMALLELFLCLSSHVCIGRSFFDPDPLGEAHIAILSESQICTIRAFAISVFITSNQNLWFGSALTLNSRYRRFNSYPLAPSESSADSALLRVSLTRPPVSLTWCGLQHNVANLARRGVKFIDR
jgi:hypothetical protein